MERALPSIATMYSTATIDAEFAEIYLGLNMTAHPKSEIQNEIVSWNQENGSTTSMISTYPSVNVNSICLPPGLDYHDSKRLNVMKTFISVDRSNQAWESSESENAFFDHEMKDFKIVELLRGGESPAHSAVLCALGLMVSKYAKTSPYSQYISVSGGNFLCGASVFSPDLGIRTGHWTGHGTFTRHKIKVLFEVEKDHQSVPEAHCFCSNLFQMPDLRAVVQIKIFKRLKD